MSKMRWQTQDDFIQDILSYSANEVNTNPETPVTVLEYMARESQNGLSSIYDTPKIEEGVTYICTGRGKGAFKMYRPGFRMDSKDDEDIIKNRLREINGPGYSNEAIEELYRKKIEFSDKEFCDATEQPKSTLNPLAKQFSPCVNANNSDSSSSSFNAQNKNHSSTSLSAVSTDSRRSLDSSMSIASPITVENIGSPRSLSPAVVPLRELLQLDKKKPKPKQNRDSLSFQSIENDYDEILVVTDRNDDSPLAWRKRNTSSNESLKFTYRASPGNFSDETIFENSNEEPLAWRRNNSPNTYFNTSKPVEEKCFDIKSPADFPALS